jgi:hypothetical protein
MNFRVRTVVDAELSACRRECKHRIHRSLFPPLPSLLFPTLLTIPTLLRSCTPPLMRRLELCSPCQDYRPIQKISHEWMVQEFTIISPILEEVELVTRGICLRSGLVKLHSSSATTDWYFTRDVDTSGKATLSKSGIKTDRVSAKFSAHSTDSKQECSSNPPVLSVPLKLI